MSEMPRDLGELGEYINRYPSLAKFNTLLERGRFARTTVDNYVRGIRTLIGELGLQDPEYALETFKRLPEIEDYFNEVIDDLSEKFSGSRVASLFKALRVWLKITGIDVDWGKVVVPAEESIVEDRIPSKQELRRLLNVANLRDQAIILVASSSGLRLNTLLTLKVGDVNFDYPDVARIMVTKTYKIGDKEFRSGRKIAKKRKFFVTYATPEAKQRTLDYLTYRKEGGENITPESPLFTGTLKGRRGTFLHKTSYDGHWERLLKRAHLTEKGRWFTLHFHTLKKYAETQFINAQVIASYREFFLGHKGGYLEANYFRGEEEKCLEEYRKAVPHLSIIEVPPSLEDLKRRQELSEKLMDKSMRGEPWTDEERELVKRYGIALRETAHKRLVKKTEPNGGDCQRIVSEEELEEYLLNGWQVGCVLPSGRIVISNKG